MRPVPSLLFHGKWRKHNKQSSLRGKRGKPSVHWKTIWYFLKKKRRDWSAQQDQKWTKVDDRRVIYMVNRNIFKTSKQIKKKKGKKNNLELVISITIEDSQSANHWLHTRNKKARLNFVREKSKTTCTVLKKKNLWTNQTKMNWLFALIYSTATNHRPNCRLTLSRCWSPPWGLRRCEAACPKCWRFGRIWASGFSPSSSTPTSAGAAPWDSPWVGAAGSPALLLSSPEGKGSQS